MGAVGVRFGPCSLPGGGWERRGAGGAVSAPFSGIKLRLVILVDRIFLMQGRDRPPGCAINGGARADPSKILQVYVGKTPERAARIHKIAPEGPKSSEFQGELQRPSDVLKVG